MGATLLLGLALGLGAGCKSAKLGKKLTFNGGELYYTKRVDKAVATRLGRYLVKDGYFDGKRKTVQIDRSRKLWKLRLVIKKSMQNDPKGTRVAKVMGMQVSNAVFGGEPVSIEFCDKYLKTVRVIKPLDGRRLEFNGGELFHASTVPRATADKLGTFLINDGYFNGTRKTVHVRRQGAGWAVRLVMQPGLHEKPKVVQAMRITGLQLVTKVFDNQPVVIHFCDKWLTTVKEVKALEGKLLMFKGGELYYTSAVTEPVAKRVGKLLVAEGFYDGKRKTLRFHRAGGVWKVQFVVDPKTGRDKIQLVMQAFADQLSARAFGGARVDVLLCDQILTTWHRVKSKGQPGARPAPTPRPATEPKSRPRAAMGAATP